MKRLPDSELEIMLIIWEAEGSVTSDYILERINRDWTKTTLLNLLSRLCGRGFLACSKEGRHNIYTPLVEKEIYLQSESCSFLERMYQNSLTKLVMSLYDGNSISKDDLSQLKEFIEEAEDD